MPQASQRAAEAATQQLAKMQIRQLHLRTQDRFLANLRAIGKLDKDGDNHKNMQRLLWLEVESSMPSRWLEKAPHQPLDGDVGPEGGEEAAEAATAAWEEWAEEEDERGGMLPPCTWAWRLLCKHILHWWMY